MGTSVGCWGGHGWDTVGQRGDIHGDITGMLGGRRGDSTETLRGCRVTSWGHWGRWGDTGGHFEASRGRGGTLGTPGTILPKTRPKKLYVFLHSTRNGADLPKFDPNNNSNCDNNDNDPS